VRHVHCGADCFVGLAERSIHWRTGQIHGFDSQNYWAIVFGLVPKDSAIVDSLNNLAVNSGF
jgi:hypothetical protein